MSKVQDRLIQYGINSDLADKTTAAGLTVTKVRTLSQKDLTAKFGMSPAEAKELSRCVQRKPIDDDVAKLLLERSNFICNVCKGQKGASYIIHHIEEYQISQNNNYGNLIVLCPTDHDLAHRDGLTLGLTAEQLRGVKEKWEAQVELINAQRAARSLTVNDNAIDYVNVLRIEELCVRLLGTVPPTTISPYLRRMGILGPGLRFDQKFVREKLSNGRYLFDYTNSSETEHYRQLLFKVAEIADFADLSQAAEKGYSKVKPLEGEYTFFIGGVYSKQPALPIDLSTPPIVMYYKTKKIRIEWDLDPNYLMSMSSIGRMGRKNRYIIYGLVRTVEPAGRGEPCRVTASPLLIAQPTKYVHKMPLIAAQKQYEAMQEDDTIQL